MKKIKLFTDSSVNPQEKVGFGAYLLLKENNISFEDMKKDIKIKIKLRIYFFKMITKF